MYETLEIVTLALIPAFLLLDLLYRKRRYESLKSWRPGALVITVINVALAIQVATFWGSVATTSVFDLSNLPLVLSVPLGLFIYEIFHYAYHRGVHSVDWIWRFTHQMHHSAESLDAFGANFLHPLDVFMFATIASLVFIPLLGLPVEAAIVGGLFLTFNAMYQHSNIATPRWLSYVIQSPENHELHHARGVHAYNYADLAIVDMMFGTFKHNDNVGRAVGFYAGASERWAAMWFGIDVSKPDPAFTQPRPPTEQLTPVLMQTGAN